MSWRHQGTILRTICFIVIKFDGYIILLSNCTDVIAHGTTVLVSWHVQNFVVIWYTTVEYHENQFWIDFELLWKNRSWNGPQVINALSRVDVHTHTQDQQDYEYASLNWVISGSGNGYSPIHSILMHWTRRNKLQGNIDQITTIFFQENTFENNLQNVTFVRASVR